MDLRQRPRNPNHREVLEPPGSAPLKTSDKARSASPILKASDALPLPLYITNTIFFTLFFSVAYFLLHRWRDKIRSSVSLHVVTLSEIAAIVSLIASFGIDFIQTFIARASNEPWEDEEADEASACANERFIPRAAARMVDRTATSDSEDDEEVIRAVVDGTVPSHSLESKLGDCRRAAAIRREALHRGTGKSLEGLPLDGFDYESILGQCCEMPVGYVQIPVGVAGPLMLDGVEYWVPMATTEGCLVASTNRGCKAIYASGGATSMFLRDGMTRAPVVRFGSVKRASELKFFLEDPANYDTLSVVFNRSSRFAKL